MNTKAPVDSKLELALDLPPQSIDVPRTQSIQDLIRQLGGPRRFVLLRGSGSVGTRYFIFRQFIPYLQDAGPEWRTVTLVPRQDPIGSLAEALAEPGVLRARKVFEPAYAREIERELRASYDGLIRLYRKARQRDGKAFKLLVVADQLEELFSYRELSERWRQLFPHRQLPVRAGDDALFFGLLMNALRSDLPIYVLFGSNSDHVIRLNNYPGWAEMITTLTQRLPPLYPHEIRSAYERASAGEMPAVLVRQISEDFAAAQGKLSNPIARVNISLYLLCHFGGQWLKQQPTDEPLTRTAFHRALQQEYQRFRGLTGCADRLFEQTYRALSPADQLVARRLFQSVTTKDSRPERVLTSYPDTFGECLEKCFRTGAEYADTLALFPQAAAAESVPTELNATQKRKLLLTVIEAFSFPGTSLPAVILPVGKYGVVESMTDIDDATILDLDPGLLLTDWKRLRSWINRESDGATLYRSLIDEARSSTDPKGEDDADTPTAKALAPHQNEVFGLWATLKTVRFSLLTLPKEPGAIASRHYTMITSRTELAGRFLHEWLPNEAWTRRYTPLADPVAKDEAGSVPTEGPSVHPAASPLQRVLRLIRRSKQHHDAEAAAKAAFRQEMGQKAKSFRSRLIIALLAIVVAVIAMVFGTIFYRMERETQNNLRLLDYVDNLNKARLIPASVYHSSDYHDLKQAIQDSSTIADKQDVTAYLAGRDVLHMAPPGSAHYRVSTAGLLALDNFVDGGDDGDFTSEEAIATTFTALTTAFSAMTSGGTEKSYQYPFVYSAQREARTALLALRDADNVQQRFSSAIRQVVSNPTVEDQFVVGDASGNLWFYDQTSFAPSDTIEVGSEISALRYVNRGRELLVGTYGGSLFRYGVPPDRDPGPPTYLLGTSTVRGAILSLDPVADRDDLLVARSDQAFLLLRQDATGQYREIRRVDLAGRIKSVAAVAAAADGRVFLLGGADATAIVELDAESLRLRIRSVVHHPAVSVSALALSAPTTGNEQRVAIGTEMGDIWLSTLGDIVRLGDDPERATEILAQINRTEAFQEAKITGLVFNDTYREGNRQLISSSLDGTVWLFNLDLLPPWEDYVLQKHDGFPNYDHIAIETDGHSITGVTRVNADRIVAVENNLLYNWPTNIRTLQRDIESQLAKPE
ncbi:hypothetical protein CLV84_1026 [Neolewinella xylanilytica]|uniref:Novel STAND NTPase 1 domain-containing protein n=1 Tax=Neolewinella xylanilytica TaxID=1514080 RepID=A0A2S6I993_9BACT|nr:hypothetical protein [Neolewinella xylanilytica]PPK88063.1 hypothetical protein CLV84_1026 [Neolewinella xylanilytica]